MTPKKALIISLIIVGIAVVAFPAYYFYSQYRHTQYLLAHPEEATREDIAKTIEKIAKLVVVPADEEPTVATVSDQEKLRDQPFFKSAQNGDKVIVYSNAKKAILYRPSTNKIVEMAPVNVPDAETITPSDITSPIAPTKTPDLSKIVKVAIYNGTTTAKLALSMQSALLEKVENVEVSRTSNATKQDYTKTRVIDLTGENLEAAKDLAAVVNGIVDTLPSAEEKPDTDLLIIIGSDYQQ